MTINTDSVSTLAKMDRHLGRDHGLWILLHVEGL